jgi:hypothetical protein
VAVQAELLAKEVKHAADLFRDHSLPEHPLAPSRAVQFAPANLTDPSEHFFFVIGTNPIQPFQEDRLHGQR